MTAIRNNALLVFYYNFKIIILIKYREKNIDHMKHDSVKYTNNKRLPDKKIVL